MDFIFGIIEFFSLIFTYTVSPGIIPIQIPKSSPLQNPVTYNVDTYILCTLSYQLPFFQFSRWTPGGNFHLIELYLFFSLQINYFHTYGVIFHPRIHVGSLENWYPLLFLVWTFWAMKFITCRLVFG